MKYNGVHMTIKLACRELAASSERSWRSGRPVESITAAVCGLMDRNLWVWRNKKLEMVLLGDGDFLQVELTAS